MPTPNFGFPTPADTNPACGQDQMRALAQAADPVFETVRGQPNFPWGYFSFPSASMTAGQTSVLAPTLLDQSAHNIFSVITLPDGPRVNVAVPGVYRGQARARWQGAGAASTGYGTFILWWVVVGGTGGNTGSSARVRAWGTSWQEVDHFQALLDLEPGVRTPVFQVNNGSNQPVTFSGGSAWLTRIGDL